MGWADGHIKKLREGKEVKFRPHGNSMSGRIEDGQLVTVEPKPKGDVLPVEGTIVLCRVKGRQLVHLVTRVDTVNRRVEISNNKGHVNGWVTMNAIYGSVVKVEP